MSSGDGADAAQRSVRGRREGFCLHGLSLGLDEDAGAPSFKNSGILCIFLSVSHLPPLWMILLLT